MSDLQDLAARYIALWNETDPTARRRQLDELWSEDGSYLDPLVEARGRDAIDATLQAVQHDFPGMVFTLLGPVDEHHGIARFRWELGPEGAEALIVGFDVLVAAADGRIAQILGFLDRVPTA
jgi:hypothetical protein